MAKIHKSSAVILESHKPVMINRPELGISLREHMMATAECRQSGQQRQALRLLEQEADSLIRKAQDEADQILADARQEAFTIRRQAYEQARAEAKKELAAAIRQQENWFAGQLTEIRQSLEQVQTERFSDLENELLALSLAIAEKIIGCELSDNEKAFRSLVQQALDRMQQDSRLTVRVSEADYCVSLAPLQAQQREDETITWVQDSQLPAGSCLIEGSFGKVDASVGSQLASLKKQWEVET